MFKTLFPQSVCLSVLINSKLLKPLLWPLLVCTYCQQCG
uniref:Uncharacterized protein n=1 Tax=Anguilla anguilla TaxID=7936 RepID=A0A0E9S2Q7_ANGAN